MQRRNEKTGTSEKITKLITKRARYTLVAEQISINKFSFKVVAY